MTSEREFIDYLAQRFPLRPPVEVGIGDDGAVLHHKSSGRQTVVTDMLLDQVHFDLRTTSPELAGRKAIAVNLSDLAAMGCHPTSAYVSLAVPADILRQTPDFLKRLYDGMQPLTEQFQFTLAGGDTNSWHGPFAINVCLTGEPMGSQPILRSTAQPGDGIFVTGALGGSLASQRHLTFTPQLKEAEWLLRHIPIHSMMDISDGLAIDLHRLTEASRVSAVIDASRIPIHTDVSSQMAADQRLAAALSDGEDFVLLFTAPAKRVQSLHQQQALPFEIYHIGQVESGKDCFLRSYAGSVSRLAASGWQHPL
jgi:thiamine-monophosphate kinase